MGDLVTFAPNTGVNPTFVGRGSKIEHPDLFPIFWGSYWPGNGELTVSKIMDALNSIVSGPYLQGLRQYGFVGPAQVRPPRVDSSPCIIPLPAAAPNVDQATVIANAVHAYIENLLDDDDIDNVDDNHDLIVLVFLDPSIPTPTVTDAFGNITSVRGANSSVDDFEFLDDNTRFEWAWIGSADRKLATVTRFLAHELVESITDPFENGWHQSSPSPGANSGQIGDVCNQIGIVNGVTVAAYWSAADGACIIPTSTTRRVRLLQTVTRHEPHDEPTKEGFVDLGRPICAAGMFDFFQRTYETGLTVQADIQGYESPIINWTLNGQEVPFPAGSFDVPATWDREPPPTQFSPAPVKPVTARLKTTKLSPSASEIKIEVGPGDGNTSFRIDVSVTESFDTASNGGKGSTRRTDVLHVDLKNQEIVWGNLFKVAKKNCEHLLHLANDPGVAIGPSRPGDPPALIDIISRAMRDQTPQRHASLTHAAELLSVSHPELSKALTSLAERQE